MTEHRPPRIHRHHQPRSHWHGAGNACLAETSLREIRKYGGPGDRRRYRSSRPAILGERVARILTASRLFPEARLTGQLDPVVRWRRCERVLDALISRFGPHVALREALAAAGADVEYIWRDRWIDESPSAPAAEQVKQVERPAGEARPKGTDEVSETSAGAEQEAATHGGDGNAGEVDAAAQTSAPDSRKRPSSADPVTSCGQDGPPAEPPPGVATGSGAQAPGVAPTAGDREVNPALPGKLAQGVAPPPSKDTSAPADDPPRDAGDVARVGVDPRADHRPSPSPGGHVTGEARVPSGERLRQESEAGAIMSPAPPAEDEAHPDGDARDLPAPPARARYGGDTAPHHQIIRALARRPAEKQAARDIERALLRLIRGLDLGGADPSPRLDGARLVREMASRRYQITRAQRREATIPLVIIACDVSGSCSASSAATLAAAYAICGQVEHVAVVEHSNGSYVVRVGHRSSVEASDQIGLADLVERFERPVAAVVAFGDTDATSEYRRLVEQGARLFWLDSYAAVAGAKPARANLRAAARDWPAQPAGWWQGINTAARAAIALRAMASGKSA